MARRPPQFEGSKADMAQDIRGARKMGTTVKNYEKTARDKVQNVVGQRRFNAMRKK